MSRSVYVKAKHPLSAAKYYIKKSIITLCLCLKADKTERGGEREGFKKQVDHRGKQEKDDKLRGGGVNKGEKKEGGCL